MIVMAASKYIVVIFATFLMSCSLLMFFKSRIALTTIAKAGSTKVIHFGELIIRTLIGLSFVLNSHLSHDQILFKIVGYFLIISAIIIMLMPQRLHQAFSQKSARKKLATC
jgi:hypothetical protein